MLAVQQATGVYHRALPEMGKGVVAIAPLASRNVPVEGSDVREKLKGAVKFIAVATLACNALAVVLLRTDHCDRSIFASPLDGSTAVEPAGENDRESYGIGTVRWWHA